MGRRPSGRLYVDQDDGEEIRELVALSAPAAALYLLCRDYFARRVRDQWCGIIGGRWPLDESRLFDRVHPLFSSIEDLGVTLAELEGAGLIVLEVIDGQLTYRIVDFARTQERLRKAEQRGTKFTERSTEKSVPGIVPDLSGTNGRLSPEKNWNGLGTGPKPVAAKAVTARREIGDISPHAGARDGTVYDRSLDRNVNVRGLSERVGEVLARVLPKKHPPGGGRNSSQAGGGAPSPPAPVATRTDATEPSRTVSASVSASEERVASRGKASAYGEAHRTDPDSWEGRVGVGELRVVEGAPPPACDEAWRHAQVQKLLTLMRAPDERRALFILCSRYCVTEKRTQVWMNAVERFEDVHLTGSVRYSKGPGAYFTGMLRQMTRNAGLKWEATCPPRDVGV